MILHRMLLLAFIPVFILALVFFILILELVDIFSNLWRYLNYDVPLKSILKVFILYIPKCVSYSIPIALLFAVSFTLGNLYSNNELISVFGSGISLFRFVLPLVLLGLLFSAGWYFFEEKVVIDTLEKKNKISQELLKQSTTYSNSNVTVLGANNKVIYYADFYNDTSTTLSNITVIEFDNENNFVKRIDAEKAEWDKTQWRFTTARVFTWDPTHTFITETFHSTYETEKYNQRPDSFRKTVRNIDEMKRTEALEWIHSLKVSGLPFRGALTEFYKRFSFALTPFIVALISSAIGGRFKKNILLMSLLLSLVISVVYYVIQMVLILFAKLGYLPPLAGAWGTFLLFLFPSFWLFKKART